MKNWQITVVCTVLLVSVNALADTVTIPNTFSSGTPAIAAEVNDNFSAIKTAVDDNDEKINQLKDNLSNNICSGFSYVRGFNANNEVICSSDLSGTGYSRRLPVYQDNLTVLEIENYTVNKPVLIVSGLGIEIDRIRQFVDAAPDYVPGLNTEQDFVIEVDLADEPGLQSMFDNPPANNKTMSVIVRDLSATEVFRYNLFEYTPLEYVDVGNGRARFTFVQSLAANNTLQIESGQNNIFGNQISNNPNTDTLIEISGIISNFYPQVEDDVTAKTLTLTYDINEGAGLYLWFKLTAEGAGVNRDISVIQQSGGIETSRKNYYEIFPVRWEIFEGFSLPQKIKARVVLSYDFSEDA